MDNEEHLKVAGLDYEPSYLSSYSFRDQYVPMKVGRWMTVIVALMVPGVNVLLLVFWAFSASVNKNLQNFSRALIIVMAFMALLGAALFIGLRYTLPGLLPS